MAKDFGLRAPRAIEREDNSVQEEWSDVFFNYVIDNMPDTSVQNQCRQFLVKYHTEQQAQKFRTLVYLGRFIRIILDQIAASSMADVLAILQFSTGMEIRQLHGLDQVNDFFEVMGEESPLLEINEMQDGSGNYRRLKFHLTRGYSVRSSTDMPPVLGVMLSRTVLKLLMQHDKDVVDHIDTSKEKHGSKSRRRRMDYVNFLNL